MSKLVAFAAIQGGYNVVSQVEGAYQKALDTFDADTKVGFPNTAYYLPVIYSLLGMKVETLEDLKKPLEMARKLLPPHIKGMNHLPYLGPLLDAGMATLFCFEIREALRYLNEPDFYLHSEEPDLEAGKIWLGAADDTVFRKRGVEFVDGTAPGFAAIVGAAPTPEIAKDIVEDYQKRSLRTGYFFGHFCPGLCQPGRHGFWQRSARRLQKDAALQQEPHLCLCQRPG